MAVPAGGGVYQEDVVPLRWSVADAETLSEEGRFRLEQTSLQRLTTINALNDHLSPSLIETDEHQGVNYEIQRLDHKVNALLEMVGYLMLKDSPLPTALPLTLYADRIVWRQPEGLPDSGSTLLVDLFLQKNFPFPVTLVGDVTESSAAEGRVAVAVQILSEQLSEALEKYVFRAHRRLIARSRRPHSNNP